MKPTMNARIPGFLRISALLTGYDEFDLQGTGMTDVYLHTLDSEVTSLVADTLIQACAALPAPAEDHASQILNDRHLGPIARNLIVLWYTGTWLQLPRDWQVEYGSQSAPGATRVVSAEAYLTGFQWTVAGAHPAGGRQQGFGSWSSPPQLKVL
jgi:hypothetical protein